MELNNSTQLKDQMSGTDINYSGAENLGTAISYLELIGGNFSDPGAQPSANSFENILVVGRSATSVKPDQIREFLFNEQNGMYVFKLGIVPKKRGIFMIAPGDAAGVYTRSDKCSKASFSFTFKDTDQHLYLYEQSRPGYTPSAYEQAHAYCFKVY